MKESPGPTVAGLFAGIGGIELGLERAGFVSRLLCEIEPGARAVLREKFPQAELVPDVAGIDELPDVDLLTAGFPCQDLSQAGGKRGITGAQSGLVQHLFRLLDGPRRPPWLFIENVSYMLRLGRGAAMTYLIAQLESRGYAWAYRVVDARSFGVPQRRQRVIMVASMNEDPRGVLFGDVGVDDFAGRDRIGAVDQSSLYGFYWTEGKRGLGWAANAVPTVKGGSGLGIPSPPAIWLPARNAVGTPSLRDAERLQGFPAGWTARADDVYAKPERRRWVLVGNAVCVDMAKWAGVAIRAGSPGAPTVIGQRFDGRFPLAAFGGGGKRYAVNVGMSPLAVPMTRLGDFLADPIRPLSLRATTGFLSRAASGRLRFPDGFLASLRAYIEHRGYEDGAIAVGSLVPSGAAA